MNQRSAEGEGPHTTQTQAASSDTTTKKRERETLIGMVGDEEGLSGSCSAVSSGNVLSLASQAVGLKKKKKSQNKYIWKLLN